MSLMVAVSLEEAALHLQTAIAEIRSRDGLDASTRGWMMLHALADFCTVTGIDDIHGEVAAHSDWVWRVIQVREAAGRKPPVHGPAQMQRIAMLVAAVRLLRADDYGLKAALAEVSDWSGETIQRLRDWEKKTRPSVKRSASQAGQTLMLAPLVERATLFLVDQHAQSRSNYIATTLCKAILK